MLESTLIAAAQLFGTAALKLERFKEGTSISISLIVRLPDRYGQDKKPKLLLEAHFYTGSEYTTVKASSLAVLMDEVYHRCGFDDKAALALETTNAAVFDALEDHSGEADAPLRSPMTATQSVILGMEGGECSTGASRP